MKYQLVLQWTAASLDDYDRMIALETRINNCLTSDGEVDGHDAGSGQMNIFIHTDVPEKVLEQILPALKAENALEGVRVAYREIAGSDYTVLWPKGQRTFNVA